MKNAIILNTYSQKIIMKSKNKQFKKNYIFISLFLVVVSIFAIIDNNYLNIVKNICVSGSPVNSLYDDNSEILFVGNNKVFNFVIPINGAIVNIDDAGIMHFEVVKSIMVMASEDGVISQVGHTLDGVKFIKIKHSDDVYSIIENIEIVGVADGEIVKKGQDIATAKMGSKVNMKIIKNNVLVNNIKINKSKIIWE